MVERGPSARIQGKAGFDDLFRVPQREAALLEGGERDRAVIVDLFGHREPRPGLGRAGVQRDAGLRGERAPRVLARTRPGVRRGCLRVGEPAESGEEVHDVALDHRRRPPRIGELIEHGASLDGLLGREPPQLVFELVLGHALILSHLCSIATYTVNYILVTLFYAIHRPAHPADRYAGRMSTSPRNAVNQVRDAGRTQAVIIGGGINGIAAFRDLALQGVEVVLVERGDFASGASAASSHMVHGGIRYLENGEFRLVRESVRERNDLLKTAPHFVKPLKTTVPIYSFWSGLLQAPMKFVFGRKGKPAERGAALIKVGLTMYDLFVGPTRRTPWHRFRGRAASLRELPASTRTSSSRRHTSTRRCTIPSGSRSTCSPTASSRIAARTR